MKRLFLLFAAVAPALCLPQTASLAPVPAPSSTSTSTRSVAVIPPAASCPVQLTSADPVTDAHVLWAAGDRGKVQGGFWLKFRNQSNRPIASMQVRGELKVKKDKYQLDAETRELILDIDWPVTADPKERITEVPLPFFLYGITYVELEKITYQDGTVWTAGSAKCGIDGPSGSKLIRDAK
jgi:hypothetical protein